MQLDDLETGHLYCDCSGDVFVYCGGTYAVFLDLGDGTRLIVDDLGTTDAPFSHFDGTVTVTPAA